MFWYFKDLRRHFILSSLAGGVIVAILAVVIMYLLFVPLPVCILIGAAYAILWTIFRRTMAERKAFTRFEHANQIRKEECRIKDYIHFYEILLETNKDPRHRRRILLNLSTGFLDLGDDSRAKEILDEMSTFYAKRHASTQKIMYLNNLTKYYIHIRDLSKARTSLKLFEEALLDPALSASESRSHLGLYEENKATLLLLEGHTDDIEDFFQKIVDAPSCLLDQIEAYDRLIILCRKQNRPDKSLAAKAYVASHGGDTSAASRARLELNNAGNAY